MLEQLMKMELPDTYQDVFVEYTEKLDGSGIIELLRCGIDKQHTEKMLLLISVFIILTACFKVSDTLCLTAHFPLSTFNSQIIPRLLHSPKAPP